MIQAHTTDGLDSPTMCIDVGIRYSVTSKGNIERILLVHSD